MKKVRKSAEALAREGMDLGIDFSDWRAVQKFCHGRGHDVTDVTKHVLRIRERMGAGWKCDSCGSTDFRLYECRCCCERFCARCGDDHTDMREVTYEDNERWGAA